MNRNVSRAAIDMEATSTDCQACGSEVTLRNVLVVDDVIANLTLLVDILKDEGYQVRPVTNGEQALRAVQKQQPDLILLDIDMPDMNGYQVCEHLKADPLTQHIPVVFLSAFARSNDKVMAFQVGGIDYVTKPFQVEEVVQRVATHLGIESLKRVLEDQNRELSQRNRELEQIRRAQTNLIHMIVHDLRSPLAGVLGYLELIQIRGASHLPAETLADVGHAVGACQNANELVASLLDLARLESADMPMVLEPLDLTKAVPNAVEAVSGSRGGRALIVEPVEPSLVARGDRQLIQRVLVNLLTNAIKATSDSETITISCRAEDNACRIDVVDNGRGISGDLLPGLFEKFTQAENRRQLRSQGYGIGLAFCRLAVEAQGGQIGVESQLGKGSRFWFTLPLNQLTESD